MRRLRLPAAVTVTVLGVVAPIAAAISACSGDDGPTHPDAPLVTDAHVSHSDGGPGDGEGSGVHDAGVPMDAPPDTPIT